MHEVVGVFTHFDKMEEAIKDLEVNGFNRLDINVLGNEDSLKDVFGSKIPDTKNLGDNPETPKSANISAEELGVAQGVIIGGGLLAGIVAMVIASGGLIVSGIATSFIIGGGAGAAVGGLLAKILGDKYAAFFQKQIDSGGLLLWVRTNDKQKEEQASEIFKKYGACDVHVHNVA